MSGGDQQTAEELLIRFINHLSADYNAGSDYAPFPTEASACALPYFLSSSSDMERSCALPCLSLKCSGKQRRKSEQRQTQQQDAASCSVISSSSSLAANSNLSMTSSQGGHTCTTEADSESSQLLGRVSRYGKKSISRAPNAMLRHLLRSFGHILQLRLQRTVCKLINDIEHRQQHQDDESHSQTYYSPSWTQSQDFGQSFCNTSYNSLGCIQSNYSQFNVDHIPPNNHPNRSKHYQKNHDLDNNNNSNNKIYADSKSREKEQNMILDAFRSLSRSSKSTIKPVAASMSFETTTQVTHSRPVSPAHEQYSMSIILKAEVHIKIPAETRMSPSAFTQSSPPKSSSSPSSTNWFHFDDIHQSSSSDLSSTNHQLISSINNKSNNTGDKIIIARLQTPGSIFGNFRVGKSRPDTVNLTLDTSALYSMMKIESKSVSLKVVKAVIGSEAYARYYGNQSSPTLSYPNHSHSPNYLQSSSFSSWSDVDNDYKEKNAHNNNDFNQVDPLELCVSDKKNTNTLPNNFDFNTNNPFHNNFNTNKSIPSNTSRTSTTPRHNNRLSEGSSSSGSSISQNRIDSNQGHSDSWTNMKLKHQQLRHQREHQHLLKHSLHQKQQHHQQKSRFHHSQKKQQEVNISKNRQLNDQNLRSNLNHQKQQLQLQQERRPCKSKQCYEQQCNHPKSHNQSPIQNLSMEEFAREMQNTSDFDFDNCTNPYTAIAMAASAASGDLPSLDKTQDQFSESSSLLSGSTITSEIEDVEIQHLNSHTCTHDIATQKKKRSSLRKTNNTNSASRVILKESSPIVSSRIRDIKPPRQDKSSRRKFFSFKV
mmetsp:Transcript_162/g.236  ORF Transcript_162/g.236 Transcript_162/m.236 type:complete len:821 (-) Transcript_162:112-2574(-)|eukprot:CAMPEP_0184869502 /NCGR_PEP_ID=MMETSP0580-20130426/34359_1 /TAXON_ID=1118495 /ORGANISM="Dactyliosolen fragilissimus" /LENGTH=820 /DNA_ID=CAMNT_0027371027 /DNA_START=122 /DNA_END=2584 /DNA_ORIENTATION=+